MESRRLGLAALLAGAVGLVGLVTGCSADATEESASRSTGSELAGVTAGMCVPARANAEFECRVGHAASPGEHRLVTTVYESFGMNVRDVAPASLTHAKVGWVRMGIDPTDRTPLAHVADYAARIRAFHLQGMKVLFNVTEGIEAIPSGAGVGGDYAADACSPDPAIANLWPRCGMTVSELGDLEDRWGITSSRTPHPRGDYVARFTQTLSAFVMSVGATDDDGRPDVWEILNEPDNANADAAHPHGHQLNVHVTAAILGAARRVVDEANRHFHAGAAKERLAFGALMMASSWRVTKGSAILAAADRGRPEPLFDLATFHVYVPARDAAALEAPTRAMAAATLGRPLMITEFGFEQSDGAGSAETAGDDAIERLMLTARALRSEKGLPLETTFMWSFRDGDAGGADHYGLVSAPKSCANGGGKTKRSFVVFAKTAESVARKIDHNARCDALE